MTASVERGPNLNLLDHTSTVRDSPLYNGWRNPVPPEWFSGNKRSYTLVDQEALYGSLQFARALGRVATDTISTPSDTSSLVAFARFRQASDVIGVPADSVTSVRHYVRSSSDSTTVTDSTFAVINRGSMVLPIIHDWP